MNHMRYIFMILLATSLLHPHCQAADVSLSDLSGVWQTELAGYTHTFVMDPRDPQKAVMILSVKMKGLATEDKEMGSMEIVDGSRLRFRVLGADNKEKRIREYAITDLSGDVLTLTWDNPPLEGVKLQRILQELPARE